MIELMQEQDTYSAVFARMETETLNGGPEALLSLRKDAMQHFEELGFPTTKDEQWLYTNVSAIAKTTFCRATRPDVAVDAATLERESFAGCGFHRLVFVNGYFASELSDTTALDDKVTVISLADALQQQPDTVMSHLAKYADYKTHAFVALNTALMEDGAFIHVPKGVVVDKPIQLLFITMPNNETSDEPIVVHPRVLIITEESSQVTVLESYVGLAEQVYFTNAVTEIYLGENAVIDHYKVQRESTKAFHITTMQLNQQRASNGASHVTSLGGDIVRNNINVVLDGEGCNCNLSGLYIPRGKQHVDNHLLVDHAKAHCDSREFFKGILDDDAHAVFTGKIIVRKDAQKTDGKQTNRNLLLSDSARVDTNPQLEIFANDVKCTHGATIGQLDDEALFYLKTRGIETEAARSLLIYAFASEILDEIKIEAVREQVNNILLDRLPQGDRFRGFKGLQ